MPTTSRVLHSDKFSTAFHLATYKKIKPGSVILNARLFDLLTTSSPSHVASVKS